jgi:uncharacterized protein YecE (DUF72 family)
MPIRGRLHLGTSGFAYDEWRGTFYPEEIKPRQMLAYYAARFGSVEINYTFRKVPSERTLLAWRDGVPDGFRFTLKANARITHWRRLADAGEDVRAFLRLASLLEDRLGVVLFQCPPNLQLDRDLLSRFLDELPPGGRFAMEFRHPSWGEARGLVSDRGVAWCSAETDEQAVSELVGEPFAYLRLRKTRYPRVEMAEWAERIRGALDAGRDVWCYFKHEEKGKGPRYARQLARLLR